MILAKIIKTIDPFMERMNKVWTVVVRLWLHTVGCGLLAGLIGLLVGLGQYGAIVFGFIGMIIGVVTWFTETFGKSESEK